MFSGKAISSDQVAFWIKKRLKTILFLLFGLIFSGMAFVFWLKWKSGTEHKVQNALYEFQKSLNALREKEESPSLEKPLDRLKEEPPPLSLNKEMREKAGLYEKALREHKRRKIAVAFAIDLADFYYKYQEAEKSIELLSLFAFPDKSSTLYHLASFQLASYYMNEDDKKGCEKALPIFSALRANKKATPFHLESDLQQALCLEAVNPEEALRKYESVLQEDPEGYSGRLAKDYKKLLILNRNRKERK